MKASRPGTNQELDLTVFADEEPLQEYVLPGAATNQNILECFIPVKAGQKISVRGRFKGITLAASFDLVVDGSFLAESKVTDKGSRQQVSRALKFERGYDCPRIKEGWTSKTQNPLDIYEGHLYVESLQDGTVSLPHLEIEDITGERPGIGSIQVVANLQDGVFEHRMDPEWDIEGGGWIHRYKQAVRFAGIKPDHAIEVRHIGDKPIPQKRSKQHRNHWNVHTRPGFKPWARFIFYYRGQDSIDHAGCTARGDTIHKLEPLTEPHKAVIAAVEPMDCDGETSREVKPPSEASSVQEPLLPNMPKFSRLGGDFTTQMRAPREDPVNKEPPAKSADVYAVRPTSDGVVTWEWAAEAEKEDHVPSTTAEPDRGMKMAVEDSSTNKDDQSDFSAQPRQRDDFLNKLTSAQQVKAQAPPQASHANSPVASDTSTHPLRPKPSPTTTPIPPISTMSQHVRYLEHVPSLGDIADMVGPEGVSMEEVKKYFDEIALEQGFNKPASVYVKLRIEYNKRVNQVATAIGTKWVLRDECQSHVQEHKPPPATIRTARSVRSVPVKREAESMTPETCKKAKLTTAALEARRAELERVRRETAAIFQQAEEKKARKAAKKARAERERAEQEAEEQRQLEQEMEMMEEELDVAEAHKRAAMVALAEAEDSSDSGDEDEGAQDEPRTELVGNEIEEEVESEEE